MMASKILMQKDQDVDGHIFGMVLFAFKWPTYLLWILLIGRNVGKFTIANGEDQWIELQLAWPQ